MQSYLVYIVYAKSGMIEKMNVCCDNYDEVITTFKIRATELGYEIDWRKVSRITIY